MNAYAYWNGKNVKPKDVYNQETKTRHSVKVNTKYQQKDKTRAKIMNAEDMDARTYVFTSENHPQSCPKQHKQSIDRCRFSGANEQNEICASLGSCFSFKCLESQAMQKTPLQTIFFSDFSCLQSMLRNTQRPMTPWKSAPLSRSRAQKIRPAWRPCPKRRNETSRSSSRPRLVSHRQKMPKA